MVDPYIVSKCTKYKCSYQSIVFCDKCKDKKLKDTIKLIELFKKKRNMLNIDTMNECIKIHIHNLKKYHNYDYIE
jgi:ABC-type proline/glycine betaine transport system substrate-binding protein